MGPSGSACPPDAAFAGRDAQGLAEPTPQARDTLADQHSPPPRAPAQVRVPRRPPGRDPALPRKPAAAPTPPHRSSTCSRVPCPQLCGRQKCKRAGVGGPRARRAVNLTPWCLGRVGGAASSRAFRLLARASSRCVAVPGPRCTRRLWPGRCPAVWPQAALSSRHAHGAGQSQQVPSQASPSMQGPRASPVTPRGA